MKNNGHVESNPSWVSALAEALSVPVVGDPDERTTADAAKLSRWPMPGHPGIEDLKVEVRFRKPEAEARMTSVF